MNSETAGSMMKFSRHRDTLRPQEKLNSEKEKINSVPIELNDFTIIIITKFRQQR